MSRLGHASTGAETDGSCSRLSQTTAAVADCGPPRNRFSHWGGRLATGADARLSSRDRHCTVQETTLIEWPLMRDLLHNFVLMVERQILQFS